MPGEKGSKRIAKGYVESISSDTIIPLSNSIIQVSKNSKINL
jgi:hypothetical protein